MIDISFLKQLDKFDLVVRKRVTSSFVGERAAPFTGRGLVFKDYTMYTPGEDYRHIDWKVFARTDKLFVRRYEEERNLTVHCIIDASASMDFGSKKLKKFEFASMIGLGYAYMALKNNEKFVLSTFSDKLELFKPKKGKRHLAAAYDYLNTKKAKGKSNLEESLARYKKMINSRSLIVIISDFLYPVDQIRNTVYRFKDHELKLVQVLDPLEVDLDIEGDFKLKDIETGETMRTFISPYLRTQYLSSMRVHNAAVQKACTEVGAIFYSFPTDYSIFDAFYYMMGERKLY